jgi:hypothetical protein
MFIYWCQAGLGVVIYPDMDITEVQNTVPYESCLVNRQNVNCKLCVYNAFYERSQAKHHACAMFRGCEGSHSLDVVWVKWLFMENSPDNVNIDIFSSFNSSHTCSWIFFRSSQYENFSKTRPCLSRHWFLHICWLALLCSFKRVLYDKKALTLFNTVCT